MSSPHPPKLQIGCQSYKKHFTRTERAFHLSDIPLPARAARASVRASLSVSVSARASAYTSSSGLRQDHNGRMHAPWDPQWSDGKKAMLDREQKWKRNGKSKRVNDWIMENEAFRPGDFAYPGIGRGNRYSKELQVSVLVPESMEKVKEMHRWNKSTVVEYKEPVKVGPTNYETRNYLTPSQAETRFLEGKRAQKELSRRNNEKAEMLHFKMSENFYRFTPGMITRPFTAIDSESHAERVKSLKETYTPDILNSYLTHLVSDSTQVPKSDHVPHSTVLDSLRPFSAATNAADFENTSSRINHNLEQTVFKSTDVKSANFSRNLVKTYSHLGTWIKIPDSETKDFAWSCCLSTVKESRGCSVCTRDMDGWNYANPTQ